MQQLRNVQQKKITKGKMMWVRTEKERGNMAKENEQTQENSNNKRAVLEQRAEELQSKEA